jgi:hypothetical protein
MILAPSAMNTSSKPREKLGVVVAQQEADRHSPIAQLRRGIPGLLGDPRRVRVGRDPGRDYPPGAELDEEQHVECLEPDRLHREQVAGHDPLGLRSKKLRPSRSAASRRGAQAVSSQQRPDGRGTHPGAEFAQLPTDPHTAPSGILPGHPQPQCDDPGVDWRPARLARLPVGPLPSDERAVPAQQCLGRDQEQGRPPLPGKRAACRCEQDAVEGGEPGSASLAAEYTKLLLEDQDLQILGRLVSG